MRINASDLMQEYEQNQAPPALVQIPPGPGPSGAGFPQLSSSSSVKRKEDAEPPQIAGDGVDVRAGEVDVRVAPASISEDGPVCELLGGEIYIYEAGEVLKVFENQGAPQ